jgi:two-component system sensor histidine kinase UhpB
LQAAIERYEMLSKATSDTIWDWDIIDKTMQYNEVFTEMFGYANRTVENPISWWQKTIHPSDIDAVEGMLYQVFKSGLTNFQIEYRFLCSDGSYKYVLDRSLVLYDALQKPIRMIGAMQDITDRKIADEAFQSVNLELQGQHIQEQKKMTRAILAAQEKERTYLGEELHDNVNQLLAGAKLYMSIEGNKDPIVKNALTYPMQLLEDAIQEIRLLTRKTVAPIKNIDLKNLLQLLVDGLHSTTNIKVNFQAGDLTNFHDDEIKLNIYRIAQEQINNIIKHAKASHVTLIILLEAGCCKMTVVDDGIGFEMKHKRTGIGLLNIIHRVESFNGRIKIDSSPNNGCSILVEIPVVETMISETHTI